MTRLFVSPVSFLILLIAMVASLAVLAWISFQAKTEQYQQSLDLHERLTKIAESKVNIQANSKQPDLLADVALGNDTPAILGATLQSKLRELAASRGLDVIQLADASASAANEDEPANGVTRKIGVRLDVSGPSKGVFGLLRSVETSKPWLFIGNVRIQSGFMEGIALPAEPPMQLSIEIWGLSGAGPVKDAP